MRRARLYLAALLLSLATRVIEPAREEEEERDDEDEGLPVGHPVVVRSHEASRMLHEGEALMKARARKSEPAPAPAPARGSLRERIERARKNA